MDLEHPSPLDEAASLPLRHRPAPARSGNLSSPQAYEAAYRFVAHYYDHERTAPILRLLEAFSASADAADLSASTCQTWQASVQATLEGAPLPRLPRPWDS